MDKYTLAFVVEAIWKHYIQEGKGRRSRPGVFRVQKVRHASIHSADAVENNKAIFAMSEPHGGERFWVPKNLFRVGAGSEEGVRDS